MGKKWLWKIRTVGILCCCMALVGCGNKKSGENIREGMAAIEALDYETALSWFDAALAHGEDEELIYRGQGIAYIGLTEYEEAANALEKSLACCDGNLTKLEFDTNYYLACAYYKGGDTKKAIQVYNAILDLRDRERNAWYLRGTLELEQDNYDEAIRDFEKAIELDKNDYDFLLDIYRSLEENGYRQAGNEYLENVVKDENKNISDYDLGRFYYYLEDYTNARNCLEKARDTGTAESALFLGMTYEALGDFNYASSVYVNFLDKEPDCARIQNQLGLCRMKMGDYEGALGAFQTGIQSENADCIQALKFNEICACEYLTDYKKAAALMENYLKQYPDDTEAKREYDFLKTR